MKYLFVSDNDWIPFGGSEVLWSECTSLMAKNGHDVSAYLKHWQEQPSHYLRMEKSGVKTFYRTKETLDLRFRHHIWNVFNRMTFGVKRLNFKKKEIWFDFLKEKKPELLIISLGDHIGGRKWFEMATELNIPYVLIVQLVNTLKYPSDDDVETQAKKYLNARKVIFCSEQNKRQLETQLDIRLTNSEINYNPFPLRLEDPPEYPKSDEMRLAFVASQSIIHKGHDILFEVLSQKKWKDRNIRITLYGGGHHQETVKRLIRYYNLSSIQVKGFVNGKDEIWKENQGLILCSRMEGMSLALLESLAYSRVPIVTALGGAEEVIKDNETGFIAKYPTPESIDDALERAWNRKEDLEAMGINSERYLREKIPFDPVKRLADLLTESC